jgi:hypothetical protein
MLTQVVRAAEPCKLLTVQEINQALGASVKPTPLGTTGCLWQGSPQRVSIVVRDASAWARLTTPISGINKTSVSGLGDAAQISDSGKENVLTLSVRQGANVIVLTVYGIQSAERQRSLEESLARLALPRL